MGFKRNLATLGLVGLLAGCTASIPKRAVVEINPINISISDFPMNMSEKYASQFVSEFSRDNSIECCFIYDKSNKIIHKIGTLEYSESTLDSKKIEEIINNGGTYYWMAHNHSRSLSDMKGDASVLLSQVNDDPISYKRVKLVSDFLDKLDESSPISSIYLSFPSIEDISATYVLSSKLEKSTVQLSHRIYTHKGYLEFQIIDSKKSLDFYISAYKRALKKFMSEYQNIINDDSSGLQYFQKFKKELEMETNGKFRIFYSK